MKIDKGTKERFQKYMVMVLCMLLLFPFQSFAAIDTLGEQQENKATATPSVRKHNRTKVDDEDTGKKEKKKGDKDTETHSVKIVDLSGDTLLMANDSIQDFAAAKIIAEQDSARRDSTERAVYGKERVFNPSPTRAVWLSALLPGLGQIYNRRYWKLPIIVGGYVGLAYATSWNNRMLSDYTKAYSDAMDNDPNTKSYMGFYPSTTSESDIDMSWLKNVLKARKDYYRRNRDLCIISMVGLYLICMVDAYVDASLAHFDITPELSMQVKPAVIEPTLGKLPSVGLQCAFNF